MKKIVVVLLCILFSITGCVGCEIVPEPEKVYTVIPKADERVPTISVISRIGAMSLYNGYNFAATSYKPSIEDVWEWNDKETIVVKEWDGYYYSKHTIAEYPELSFYIFYLAENFAPNPPLVWYCYFVIPISSEEVSIIQEGDPYSKFQEQYGSYPIIAESVAEVVHSDGEILFCRIDFEKSKIVEVRPGLPSPVAPMIKEILEFEATLE